MAAVIICKRCTDTAPGTKGQGHLHLWLYTKDGFNKKGKAAGTAAWVTDVGNEFGQVLMCVLTASEGDGLLPMCSGIVERYRRAGEAPPNVLGLLLCHGKRQGSCSVCSVGPAGCQVGCVALYAAVRSRSDHRQPSAVQHLHEKPLRLQL